MNFLRAATLKCDVWRCSARPRSIIAIVSIKSRNWHYNAQTSHFKMAACMKFIDQNKLLGVNYIQRIIKFELLM